MPASNSADALTDPRHAKRLARDKSADGTFVFAVRTTGVFCKPSCGARHARPENIEYFDTVEAAQAAGYRPCLRCRPTLGLPLDPTTDLMRAMADFIAARADEALSLERLAAEAQMSPFHFQRTFKAIVGISPRDYQVGLRVERLKTGLKAGLPVLDAALDAGFGSTSRVYERIEGGLGMTPAAYRAGGAGETIFHTTRVTPFGLLMMAAADRGVCFVQFGESEEALLDMLRSEFPKAELTLADCDGNQELDLWMQALDDHLSRGQPRPDLPLDLRGTAFQLKVWKFLLSVKPGDVLSYSEVAQAVGAPRAVRAAASACGANRIGVLVPCHRVLRADGGLGGYRWGMPRKEALLAMEARTFEMSKASAGR